MSEGRSWSGAVVGNEVVRLLAADPLRDANAMFALLEAACDDPRGLRRRIDECPDRVPLAEIALRAPIARPPKILCVGLNYMDHIRETGRAQPEYPVIFNKQSTAVIGPFEPIHIPRAAPDNVDYEGELAFVIGRRCRAVPRDRAAEVIAGYTIVNDVSVRTWQRRTPTMTMGKSWDTHCPLGPWIVTADAIGDPHALGIRTFVGGELRQSSNTRELLFDCFALVEHLSTVFSLEIGDVVSTGTPGGVGAAMNPPRYLAPGDRVRVCIEGIGELENPVIAEPF